MAKLHDNNVQKVIDLLTERLEFERAGVKLYDSILTKMRVSSDPSVVDMIGRMQEHREEEKEHEEFLEEQIRALGGDAHTLTPMAELVKEESKGIEDVILHETRPLPEQFHALLGAELQDNAGWDLLVQLADEAGDHVAKRAFRKRLHEEADHLLFVREAIKSFAVKEVLAEGPFTAPNA